MLGSGVFINTVLLSKATGALGALVYFIVGIIMLPLILVTAELTKYHQGGTFYEFGKTLHPFIGFLSSWSYFTAKLASSALGIHIFVTILQLIFGGNYYSPLFFDTLLIILFMGLNMLNLRFGKTIQYGFIIMKMIPILFILITMFFFFSPEFYTSHYMQWQGIAGTIPFVLFAFSGFEAICSLSRTIKDPETNGPKAILYSFAIVLALVTLYQFGFFGMLGTQLNTLSGFQQTFPALTHKILHNNLLESFFNTITLIGIACSSLGASYGIMYSNSWNLYALALNKHTIAAHKMSSLNKHHIPYICVLIEGILALAYIWITRGNQVPLQQISALGSVIAYFLSTCSFLYLAFFLSYGHKILATLSLGTCIFLIITTVRNGMQFGMIAYVSFLAIIIFGTVMFYSNNRKS